MSSVRTLQVTLGDVQVGHLTHYPDGKTMFVIGQSYIDYGRSRPILSLSLARPDDEDATRALLTSEKHKSAWVKAPPYFSNLLPEGGLRRRIAAELKIHEDQEFDMLLALGNDLPGAVTLKSVGTPDHMLDMRPSVHAADNSAVPPELKFSLGGMQLKFSMLLRGDRFTVPKSDELGNFIVKPSSNDFAALPNIEAAAMELARVSGIDVPEVRLIPPASVSDILKFTGSRDGPFYAIRRFDRGNQGIRIHTEDFAQVFNLRTNDKYGHANYEQIARTLLLYGQGLADVREMSRRLVLNLLIGNGDAHVKNWSLLYKNPLRPQLSPAYDLVPTIAYTEKDETLALNMGGVRKYQDITIDTFAGFLKRVGIFDIQRDDVLVAIRETAEVALSRWESIFQAHDVPQQLINKIGQHQSTLSIRDQLSPGVM